MLFTTAAVILWPDIITEEPRSTQIYKRPSYKTQQKAFLPPPSYKQKAQFNKSSCQCSRADCKLFRKQHSLIEELMCNMALIYGTSI